MLSLPALYRIEFYNMEQSSQMCHLIIALKSMRAPRVTSSHTVYFLIFCHLSTSGLKSCNESESSNYSNETKTTQMFYTLQNV